MFQPWKNSLSQGSQNAILQQSFLEGMGSGLRSDRYDRIRDLISVRRTSEVAAPMLKTMSLTKMCLILQLVRYFEGS